MLDLLEDNPDVRGAYDALTQLTQRRHDADDQDIGWAWNLYRAEQAGGSMGEKAKVQVLQSALEAAPTGLGSARGIVSRVDVKRTCLDGGDARRRRGKWRPSSGLAGK